MPTELLTLIDEDRYSSFEKIERKYTDIQALTYENAHEFIDKILIDETDKERATRRIDIHYSFVGLLNG